MDYKVFLFAAMGLLFGTAFTATGISSVAEFIAARDSLLEESESLRKRIVLSTDKNKAPSSDVEEWKRVCEDIDSLTHRAAMLSVTEKSLSDADVDAYLATQPRESW